MLRALKFILLLLSTIVASDHHRKATEFTAKLVHHIANQRDSQFVCWIYNLESADDAFIMELLQQPALTTIPRLVMTSTNTSVINPFDHKPSVIVIRCIRCENPFEWKHLKFYRVPGEVKIIVAHEIDSQKRLVQVIKSFDRLKLLNVVFVDLNNYFLHYSIFYKQKLISIDSLTVPPSKLFIDQTRDLNGYVVMVSCYFSRPETTYFAKYNVHGRDFQWIRKTARHLNGTSHIVKVNCEKGKVTEQECDFRRKYRSSKKDPFDINLDPAHEDFMMPFFIDDVEPDRNVIRVPTGQRLSILELFFVPFSANVWLVLVLLIVVCWMLIHYFSNIFANDPILAAICSIEKISFYRTRTSEKLLTIAITVLFFYLLRAYETKIIALMTSYPYKSDPRDLEDMRRMGIKIAHYKGYSNQLFMHIPELQDLIETLPANVSAELTHGMIGEETLVNLLITRTNCFHRMEVRPRFAVLKNYRLGFTIRQFYVASRSPLGREFKRSQRIFFEAGLRKLWMDQVFYVYRLRSQMIAIRERGQGFGKEEDDMLAIDELMPAWYVIWYGLVGSVIVCLGEILFSYCWNMKNR